MMTACENCDGEGGFEVSVLVSKWSDDPYGAKWIDCPQCNGSGWAQGEGEPIDDLNSVQEKREIREAREAGNKAYEIVGGLLAKVGEP